MSRPIDRIRARAKIVPQRIKSVIGDNSVIQSWVHTKQHKQSFDLGQMMENVRNLEIRGILRKNRSHKKDKVRIIKPGSRPSPKKTVRLIPLEI